ncbi:MAG: hypothetical protein QOI38_2698 [Sphingomonadales bacterium]|jgi:hypothetical protein|nr:hypothetical protein [Sphingomonadales bacterium]
MGAPRVMIAGAAVSLLLLVASPANAYQHHLTAAAAQTKPPPARSAKPAPAAGRIQNPPKRPLDGWIEWAWCRLNPFTERCEST